MKQLTRPLLIIAGTLCFAFGVIGIFLPILPTTPFLLLAAACYARSSQRFYDWLLNNRWFGAYVRNYREGKGIPLKQKVMTLITLWLTIGATIAWFISNPWVKGILLVIAAGVTIHLVRSKTYSPSQDERVVG